METLLGVCSAEHAQDKIPPRIPVSLLCGKKKERKKPGCVWWLWWWMGPYGGIAGISLAASVTLTAGDIHHIVLRHNLFFFFLTFPLLALSYFPLNIETRKERGSAFVDRNASAAKPWWRS